MADNKPIEIKIDNKEVLTRLQELASRGENLRPLMKNIAGIMATATEDNFKDEGRPEKWVDLSETTKKQRQKIGKYPGQILQVSGQLASSVSTAYDDSPKIRELYKDFEMVEVERQNGINNRQGTDRTNKIYKELLIANYPIKANVSRG